MAIIFINRLFYAQGVKSSPNQKQHVYVSSANPDLLVAWDLSLHLVDSMSTYKLYIYIYSLEAHTTNDINNQHRRNQKQAAITLLAMSPRSLHRVARKVLDIDSTPKKRITYIIGQRHMAWYIVRGIR